ncbi:MBL fold metallo-hydrolase RNA specificity domain-containing protein [Pararhodonellum marinum]|uniref:MBL fold metallo-hydrolase RNA specificity domain-containing protein n=1 Tax=Pararhodonellum marinum TaxID=2755358 RepID=UPI00188DE2B8|nr:MBL fold metallo-hydrolase [Pararhodonellum marinum]
MDVKIKFLGAAKSVTGSKFLLDIDQERILVDCGMFQGLKELRERNWQEFPTDPSSIDMVLLTHAHIDHIGYLPKLVKAGFRGHIYCSEPTLDLVKIMLVDSGKLQEEEAAYAQRKGYSKHEKPQPLYTVKDAEMVFPMLISFTFGEEVKLSDKVTLIAYNAGHILGASILKLRIHGGHQTKRVVFSGDLGRYHDPLLNPPVFTPLADVVIMESTYGNRVNETQNTEEQFGRAIREGFRKGGVIIIPSFAVGRTQLVLYYLHRLQQKGKIPSIPIYVDSPMAIDVTNLYKKYAHYHRLGPSFEEPDANPFLHKNLHYYRHQEESMSLNAIRGDAIIISASGMATGGRILHHLYNRLPNEQDTVIFVGYQAAGTRGRRLLNGEPSVKMYGVNVPVKASIQYIDGLSAHADRDELIEWSEGFTQSPKMVFLVHGEEDASNSLAQNLKDVLGWNVLVPDYLESFILFQGI